MAPAREAAPGGGMRVILVTGGVRAGKSRYAERLARELGGDDVVYIATGIATDGEMAARIARHRAARPTAWATIEAPRAAGVALREAAAAVVLLDCLTFLVANAVTDAFEAGEDAARESALAEVAALLAAADARAGTLVVVTNEVGLGVVPATPLGRWFRDALGEANQRVAARAERVVLMVSGLEVVVKGAAGTWNGPGAASPPAEGGVEG